MDTEGELVGVYNEHRPARTAAPEFRRSPGANRVLEGGLNNNLRAGRAGRFQQCHFHGPCVHIRAGLRRDRNQVKNQKRRETSCASFLR